MENLTPAEKARAGRAHYARERRKNPDVKAKEKQNRENYWTRYFESTVRPALDAKINESKGEKT